MHTVHHIDEAGAIFAQLFYVAASIKHREETTLSLSYFAHVRSSAEHKPIVQLYAVLSAECHLCNRMRTSIIETEGNILEILLSRTYPKHAHVEKACANCSKCAVYALRCFYSITVFRDVLSVSVFAQSRKHFASSSRLILNIYLFYDQNCISVNSKLHVSQDLFRVALIAFGCTKALKATCNFMQLRNDFLPIKDFFIEFVNFFLSLWRKTINSVGRAAGSLVEVIKVYGTLRNWFLSQISRNRFFPNEFLASFLILICAKHLQWINLKLYLVASGLLRNVVDCAILFRLKSYNKLFSNGGKLLNRSLTVNSLFCTNLLKSPWNNDKG